MPHQPVQVVILGATGSIGQSTLKVLQAHPEHFRLLGAAAHSNENALREIARRFHTPHTALFSRSGLPGLLELASLPQADVVIVATTGTSGLQPMLAALREGKTVGLASKEILVLGGRTVMQAVQQLPGQLLPVDSEHNALFQCLRARPDPSAQNIRKLLLTASGGPFLHHSHAELQSVTFQQALRHPNWDMGTKITLDSATMANKGLEMIEARWLFDIDPDRIQIVIHPQSIIHSMVEFLDGSVIAQLSPPSMTFAIQHVLSFPESLPPSSPSLDFTRISSLELRPPDETKFPCLRLARQSLQSGDATPALFNAANAVAVEAFANEQISFTQIPELIEDCLQQHGPVPAAELDHLPELENDLLNYARHRLQILRS